jgi:hypothetical protein
MSEKERTASLYEYKIGSLQNNMTAWEESMATKWIKLINTS